MIIQLDSDDKLFKDVGDTCDTTFDISGCYERFYYRGGNTSSKIIVELSGTGKILGFCVWASDDSEIVHITHFATLEKYRKKGIGTKMMEWMRNTFWNKQMYLHVSVKNDNAIKLYTKMGFDKCNIIMNYYKDVGYGIYAGEGTNACEMICNPIAV